jgi:FkbM family methyltransferase
MVSNYIRRLLKSLKQRIRPSLFDIELNRWHKDLGDQTLRLNHSITAQSLVFDVGSFNGQWASDIYAKYRPKIYCFEIVPEFADTIHTRFIQNSDITVFRFGLGSQNTTCSIALDGVASSSCTGMEGSKVIEGEIVDIVDFLQSHNITLIDLMKINIEGGEFELLERLIESRDILKINNLQIQFHNFISDAYLKREKIINKLHLTHERLFCYEFVWEAWRLKN